MTQSPPHAELRKLVASVIDEMNRLAPDDDDLDRQWNGAQAVAATLEPEELRVIASPDASSMKMFRDYQLSENRDYGMLFETLATRGRLPGFELRELVDTVKEFVKFTVRVDVRAGKPVIETVPDFGSDAGRAQIGRAAYAMLMMAQADDVGFRVVCCKHCKKLVLVEHGGRGRRRSDFCSPAHGNAYAQAQHREEKKRATKAVARKHK